MNPGLYFHMINAELNHQGLHVHNVDSIFLEYKQNVPFLDTYSKGNMVSRWPRALHSEDPRGCGKTFNHLCDSLEVLNFRDAPKTKLLDNVKFCTI